MRFLSTFLNAPLRDSSLPTASENREPASTSRQLLLVTMFSVEQARIAGIIDRTAANIPGRKVVYVTDTLDFGAFRQRNATFEYIPPLSEQNRHAEAMNWPRYLKRRWELIEAKWMPTQFLAYGLNFDRLLTAAERAAPPEKP